MMFPSQDCVASSLPVFSLLSVCIKMAKTICKMSQRFCTPPRARGITLSTSINQKHLINIEEKSVGNGPGSGVSQRLCSRWHYRVLLRVCGKEGERSLAVWEFQQGRDISKTCREKSQQPGCEELSLFLTVVWSAPQLLPKVRKVWPCLHCANVCQTPQSPIESAGLWHKTDVFVAVLFNYVDNRAVSPTNLPKELSAVTWNKLKGHYRSQGDGKTYSTSTWSWRWLQPRRYWAFEPATVLACIAITVNNNDEVFASLLPHR